VEHSLVGVWSPIEDGVTLKVSMICISAKYSQEVGCLESEYQSYVLLQKESHKKSS
jgi:hypothetical protein